VFEGLRRPLFSAGIVSQKLKADWVMQRLSRRFLSSKGASLDPFETAVKVLHRDRSARVFSKVGDGFEYIRDAAGEQLVDRIEDIARDFHVAVDLGCHSGNIGRILAENDDVPGGIQNLIQLDPSKAMVELAEETDLGEHIKTETKICALETCSDVLDRESVDLVLSNLALHWANNAPATLKEIAKVLKPDGAFIGSMFSGETLFELRTSLAIAEQEREGGISAHISPMIRNADACGLLNAAGFQLATVDMSTITVDYESAFACMEHLSMMGESNAIWNRRPTVSKDTMLAAACIYESLFGQVGEDGKMRVPATFEIVFMIGWKPHESQPKPLKPSKADKSIGDLGKRYGDIIHSSSSSSSKSSKSSSPSRYNDSWMFDAFFSSSSSPSSPSLLSTFSSAKSSFLCAR